MIENLQPEPDWEASASPAPEFVALFIADQSRLYRLIVTLLGTHQDADDVLQETALVLWRKFSRFEPNTSFYAWAAKIAYYAVLQHRRKKGRTAPQLDPEVLERLCNLAARQEAPSASRSSALERCLAKLPADDRALLERYYVERSQGRAIAAELGRPETSIYRSLGRMRRKLAECINRTLAAWAREGDLS